MKRFALLLSLLALSALVPFGAARAQITIQSVQRDTGCELRFLDAPPVTRSDRNDTPGPYFMDLNIDQGAYHLRSVHDSAIILDGSTLNVSGSFLGTLSTTDPDSTITLSATANLIVDFTPLEPSTVALDVEIPAGGEVYFFDLTAGNYDFDHPGPGVFTLDDNLVTGHIYLFQVFYGVSIINGWSDQEEETVTLSMTVAPGPVADQAASWGEVKALYR